MRFAVIILLALTLAAGTIYVVAGFNAPAARLELKPAPLPAPTTVAFDAWYAAQAKEIVKAQEEEKESATIFFVGDMMLSRKVEQTMLEKKDFSYCFKDMKRISSGADLAVGNLESPIIAGKLVPTGSTTFRADPKSAESLAYAGFDVVTIANNHIGDQGQEGIAKTVEYLGKQHIDYVGGGLALGSVRNPVIKEVKGMTIAFLGYGYGPDQYGVTAKKAGMVLMNKTQMIKDVTEAKKTADMVVVMMHDGTEYQANANMHQIAFAHAAIDQGADLVIGHHPHVVQNHEVYKDKNIYYSLGNFVFDQMWSEPTKQGLSLLVTVTPEGVAKVDYYPVIIENYCKPRLADEKESKIILDRL